MLCKISTEDIIYSKANRKLSCIHASMFEDSISKKNKNQCMQCVHAVHAAVMYMALLMDKSTQLHNLGQSTDPLFKYYPQNKGKMVQINVLLSLRTGPIFIRHLSCSN